jgi:hypothetical protein
MMSDSKIYVLATKVLIDREWFNSLKNVELIPVMEEIRQATRDGALPAEFQSNISATYSRAALLNAINNNTENLADLCEFYSIDFSDEYATTMRKFFDMRKHLLEMAETACPLPPYPFATRPSGFNIVNEVVIFGKLDAKNRKIRRTSGAAYLIRENTLKRVWKNASEFWAGNVKQPKNLEISADGYYRTTSIYTNQLKIGCQTIERYELEALAEHLKWDFPVVCS